VAIRTLLSGFWFTSGHFLKVTRSLSDELCDCLILGWSFIRLDFTLCTFWLETSIDICVNLLSLYQVCHRRSHLLRIVQLDAVFFTYCKLGFTHFYTFLQRLSKQLLSAASNSILSQITSFTILTNFTAISKILRSWNSYLVVIGTVL